MSTSNTMLEVRKYQSFAEINKESPEMVNQEIGLPKVMNQANLFGTIFANNPRNMVDTINLDINLNDVEKVWKNTAQYKSGYVSFKRDTLISRDEKTFATCRDIAKIFMPILLVEENPNKFLKLALDYRKNKTVMASYSQSQIKNTKPLEEHDVTNPLDNYYIGLDKIGQFLNFCVLLRQLPTTSDNMFKTTEEIPKLSFDRDVIKELVKQVDDERKELDELIGQNKIPEYKDKLDSYRQPYDVFCKNDKYSNETFCSWMTNHVHRNYSLGEHGPKPEITNKNELNKLLRLDAYLKCKESVEYFINRDVLNKSTLNFFQGLWNSFMNLIGAGEKHFYKEQGSVEFKANKIIPPKQPTENSIIPSTKDNTKTNVNEHDIS